MPNKRTQGAEGEDLAVDYLEKKGYRILDRNFRYDHGEIDIIAEDEHRTLVFIEVKARRTKTYGDPEDAVTVSKRKKIRKTADGYIFLYSIDDQMCRFDIIAIEYERTKPTIRHIEDAF
jgi:putative endonuclease